MVQFRISKIKKFIEKLRIKQEVYGQVGNDERAEEVANVIRDLERDFRIREENE